MHKISCGEKIKSKINSNVRKLAFSKNFSTYDDVLSRLRKLAPRSFLDYFDKNWHECRAMSAGYETFCVENLGNTTNN